MKKNSKYKVLLTIESLGLGGNEKQLVEILKNFNYDAFSFKVFVLNKGGEREKYLKNLNIDIFSVEKNFQKHIDRLISFYRIVKNFKPDIVLCYDLLTTVQFCIPSRLMGVKIFIVQFAGSFLHSKKVIYFLKFLKYFIREIVCNSDAGANYLHKVCKVPFKKLRIIYNGFDFKVMENPIIQIGSLRKELNISANFHLIGLVGKLNEDKDPLTFIKAAKIVNGEFPEANFVIIGDGPYKEDMEKFIKENNMSNYFFLVPKREDAPWLISEFDIGVLSSKNEGFPNVLLEYMYWKKPVITTRAGIADKIVKDQETGFVVEKGDYENFAKAIIFLLKNKEKAKKFGEKGRERLEEEFPIEKNVKEYYDLFLEMLKENEK